MSVIKINAITVPAEGGDRLAQMFAQRAGAVDGQDGFEGFELLQPTDGRLQWLVVTRWRDEGSFNAWLSSPDFAHGHRGAKAAVQGAHGVSEPAGGGPPATVSELWSYQVATAAGPRSMPGAP